MYVTCVPNRSSPPAVLLRESLREDGRVKTRTLANLTRWPDAKVEALRRVLRGETVLLSADRFAIERALARRHLRDGTLVLYDVTSSYLERAPVPVTVTI